MDTTPKIGLIIIGDEILSGRRQDKHFAKVVELLSARGMQLAWAQYMGDDRLACIDLLKRSFASGDVVFSCGGIGATPDDHTRQSAAAALGVPLELHPGAAQRITARTHQMLKEKHGLDTPAPDMSTPEHQQRLKMGEFPQGAQLIENPFNNIPGFNVGTHYFVPGFPVMAWPMIESVLDGPLKHLHRAVQWAEHSVFVYETPESAVTPLMESIEQRFESVKTFSLPSVGEGGQRRHIELGVKGPPALAQQAFDVMKELLDQMQAPWSAQLQAAA